VSAQGAGHSPEPPTERAVVPGGNARRPTGPGTTAIRQREIEAEERLRAAELAAEAENARRDDTRALVREVFAGFRGLSDSCARFLPTYRTVAIVGAVVLGLAALAWGGSVAFDAAGLGLRVGEGAAEFDAHNMQEGGE
jgi:hypothetical protein